MIIDFHSHSFPDTLAPKAIASLSQNNSAEMSVVAHTDGTAADAEKLLRSAGIDRAVVCNIATNARQEYNVNSFAISLRRENPFFYPLGSLHPDSDKKEEELDRLLEAGIKGIKLHPDYVGIPVTDGRFDEIFSLAKERGFFVVVHAGLDPVSPNFIHATSKMLSEVIKKHKGLKLVAAHMGGFKMAGDALEFLVGTDIYIDTSLSSLRSGERENLIKILKEHHGERLLFATDTPWSNPKEEIDFVLSAGLPQKRLDRIFWKNALDLIGK